MSLCSSAKRRPAALGNHPGAWEPRWPRQTGNRKRAPYSSAAADHPEFSCTSQHSRQSHPIYTFDKCPYWYNLSSKNQGLDIYWILKLRKKKKTDKNPTCCCKSTVIASNNSFLLAPSAKPCPAWEHRPLLPLGEGGPLSPSQSSGAPTDLAPFCTSIQRLRLCGRGPPSPFSQSQSEFSLST